MLTLCACSNDNQPPELEVPEEFVPTVSTVESSQSQEVIPTYSATLYYSDGHDHLIPINQKVSWQEGIAKSVLYHLAVNPDTQKEYESMGLYATLPEDVSIDLDISATHAVVDLVSSQLPRDAKAQKLMEASIVNTLMDFENVSTVEILWNHQKIENYADDTAVPDHYTAQVLNLEDDFTPEQEGSTATLYFCNSTGDFLVPVERFGPIHDAQTAVQQLTKAPASSGLSSLIPEGCEVLDVRVLEDSVLVNFSDDFRTLADQPESLNLAYRGIAETIRPYADFETLEFYVEGELFEWTAQTISRHKPGEFNQLP